MTRSNPYQIIDSLLAEIDRLNAVIASLQEQEQPTSTVTNEVVNDVAEQQVTTEETNDDKVSNNPVNQPLTVSASSLLPDGNTELDEFAVDLEEEDLTEESIVSLVFDDLTPKPEADKLKSLVLELDRALNKVSCLKDDKESMLKAVYIELLGSDFKDNDDYARRYKLLRSAIASSVEAMKFDIIRRMKK